MANRKKQPTKIDRWDKDVLIKCKTMFPNSSSAEISRFLYNTSMIRLEQDIRKWNDKLEVKFGIKKKQKR